MYSMSETLPPEKFEQGPPVQGDPAVQWLAIAPRNPSATPGEQSIEQAGGAEGTPPLGSEQVSDAGSTIETEAIDGSGHAEEQRAREQAIMNARALIARQLGNTPQEESKKRSDKAQKEKRANNIAEIAEAEVEAFAAEVKDLDPVDRVKVLRLVRADGSPSGKPHRTSFAEKLRDALYRRIQMNFIARLGTDKDGTSATLSEFTTGEANGSGEDKYIVVEETEGWVVDTADVNGASTSVSVGHLLQLQQSGRAPEFQSQEEKWLAEILLYGAPSDREAYSVLGALGDGTFSRVKITGDGMHRTASIVGGENEFWIVGDDGRSWDKAYPLVGSEGNAYVVISSAERHGAKSSAENVLHDNILARALAELSSKASISKEEFEHRIAVAKDLSRQDQPNQSKQVATIRTLYKWLITKKTV